jgi:hypothetical protein
MYIPFEQLPATSRLWVYAAPRPFTEEELQRIQKAAPQFLNGWATHGTPLQTSYQVLENQFLILAVNEAVQAASGCSIDSSVGFIRNLEQQLGLSLTDRTLVYFLIDDQVAVYPLTQLKPLVKQETITPDTTLINTLVATKDELEQKWLVPAGESWLKRYFKKTTI